MQPFTILTSVSAFFDCFENLRLFPFVVTRKKERLVISCDFDVISGTRPVHVKSEQTLERIKTNGREFRTVDVDPAFSFSENARDGQSNHQLIDTEYSVRLFVRNKQDNHYEKRHETENANSDRHKNRNRCQSNEHWRENSNDHLQRHHNHEPMNEVHPTQTVSIFPFQKLFGNL